MKRPLLTFCLLLTTTAAMAQDGYLPTPGASSPDFSLNLTDRGYLQTPGITPSPQTTQQPTGLDLTPRGLEASRITPQGEDQQVLGSTGFLPTPGVDPTPTRLNDPTYIGRVADGQLENRPTGTRQPSIGDTIIGETISIPGAAPGWQDNMGPYSLPRWQHSHNQALWSDTRPRDAQGNPVPVDTFSNSLRAQDLPNPNHNNPDAYQPRHLYDRFQPSRPGGDVVFNPFDREDGGVTNIQGNYVDTRQDSRMGRQPHAPAWVSRWAETLGQLDNLTWGQPVVYDGDTILMNNQQIRLAGIDAPELGQTCQQGSLLIACGTKARDFLAHHTEHKVVACLIHYVDVANRLISTCRTEGFELNGTMIHNGHALVWANAPSPYEGMAADARDGGAGMWSTTFIHPNEWRKHRTTRATQQGFANQYDRAPRTPFPYVPFGTNPEVRHAPTFQNPVPPQYYTRTRP